MLQPHKSELTFGCTDAYQKLELYNFKPTINKPDNCCCLKDGSIIAIEHIAHQNEKPIIIGKKFANLSSFPNYPSDSQAKSFSETVITSSTEITKKAVVLPLKDEFYILPLMHSTQVD